MPDHYPKALHLVMKIKSMHFCIMRYFFFLINVKALGTGQPKLAYVPLADRSAF